MADTITVTYKVNEDGSLKAIGQDAEKAAKSTDKASKSSDNYSKKNKGVAGATANGTKAFSKMTTGISTGLVPAYATLAANVFALTAAFGLLSRNDAIGKLNEGLEYTGALAGRNLTMVADKLQEITGNAISAEQAMRAVAIGVSAGFSEDQLNSLTRVAKGASLALGRDMGDAMDRLIRGAAKLEPEILDELGIMVRLDDATKTYADSINKTVAELTQFERRMAFTNAIIADGEKKFQAIQAAIDPSEYGQLSATFSDLTKSIIQVVNNGLGPMFGFLAANKFALGAVVAGFAASISKDLVGSIKSHTIAAAENAKVSANQSKAQLKRIKVTGSMTKHMKGLASADKMSEKQLRKLQRLSHSQVNLMNKSNPSYKTALKTRRALTLATFNFTLATQKENTAVAIGMLTTHGFTLARAEFLMVQEGAAAATLKATIGQDFLTAAMIRAKAATLSIAAATKFYGIALLMAFPMIMAIITAIAILGPMIVGLFKEPEDGLSKQLKKNAERTEGFTDVVKIYTEQIRLAETVTEAWFKTIKPLGGLFSQVSTAMKDTNLEADTKLIVANAKARMQLQKSKDFKKSATSVSTGYGFQVASKQVTSVEEAEAAIPESLILGDNDLNAIQESNINLVAELIATIDQMSLSMEKDTKNTKLHKDAVNVLTGARAGAVSVLTLLEGKEGNSLENSKAAQGAIKTTTDALLSATAAYESFNEIVAKAQNLSAVKTFGLFAAEIDNVTEAVNSLDMIAGDISLGAAAAEEEAERMVAAYGLIKKVKTDTRYVGGNPLEVPILGKDGEKVRESALKTVKDFKTALKTVNEDAKKLEESTLRTSLLEDSLGKNSVLVYAQLKDNANEELRIKKEQLKLTKKGGEDELQNKLAVLEAERTLLGLIKDRYDFLAGEAKDSGMGSAAEAAIKGQGGVSAAKAATYADTTDKDGNITTAKDNKKAAVSAATLAQQKDILAGVAADLAAIGPEGALMSAAIEGALNVQTAFSTAFEVMGDDSASMSTKIQAGLGAVSSMLSAYAQISKASSDDKVRGIDQEIAAEKKRDGSSEASLSKISGLEKKKEKEQKKAFETNKKMKMAQTAISTASGALAAYTSAIESGIPAPYNMILGATMAAAVVAMGAKQMAMISSTSFQGGGSAGSAPSGVSVGSRSNSVDLSRGRSPSGELGYARGESGQGEGMTNFRPTGAFAGYKHRAGGGYIVGEQGPEVFMPDVPGEIIPSGQNSGGTTNVNFSISAVDARGIEDLLMNQRGNIIGMIRESANAHGELFLEGINTMSGNEGELY